MHETLSEAEKLGAALLFEQQIAWRVDRDAPPWLCERVREASEHELVRMARVLVDSNRDLSEVFKMYELPFLSADGFDRGRRAQFAELLAGRFGPLSEAHRKTVERSLPRQLTAWASKVWSVSALDEVLRDDVSLPDYESRLRGQRWLLRQELRALENKASIDIDAKIANAHPELELPYLAQRVLGESDVGYVFRITTAQRLFVHGFIRGVREVLDRPSMRDSPLRASVEEELASALAFQRSYQSSSRDEEWPDRTGAGLR